MLKQADQPKHPWLAVLEASPQQAVADLMAGYAAVFPYTRADAPDVARMLVGHLPDDDPARKAMATGLFTWLEEKRVEPLPADPARRQDFVRQVSEAFEIISLVGLVEPALKLRDHYVLWFAWANRLELAPSRDARELFSDAREYSAHRRRSHCRPRCACAILDAPLPGGRFHLSEKVSADRIARSASITQRD